MTTSDNNDPLGFAKLIPGFEFLQGLTKGAAQAGKVGNPATASFNQWFTPSLSAEDLDKRIDELKTVQFWLEQNSRALAATIQALEVQKMTLATLKGMNFPMPAAFGSTAASADKAAAKAAAAPEPKPAQPAAAGAAVDPMQLWGALTQQFQNIAASALKDLGAAAGQAPGKAAAAAKKAGPKTAAPRATGRTAAKKTGNARSGGRA